MTSANTTEYLIFDKSGTQVGRHHVNWLCKLKWDKLLKFDPPEDYEILDTWYDEEEEYFEGKRQNLATFLNNKKLGEEKLQKQRKESNERFRADKLNMTDSEFREKYNLCFF